MVRRTRIGMVLGAVILLASACGTDGKTPFAPEVKPAFDGLGTGGNVAEGGSGGTESSTTSETTMPTDTTTVGRGGLGTGGN